MLRVRFTFVLSFLPKLFVKSNQGGEETTKINYLTFIGTPVQATNMNDFKRVGAGFYLCLRFCGVCAAPVVRKRAHSERWLFRLWGR